MREIIAIILFIIALATISESIVPISSVEPAPQYATPIIEHTPTPVPTHQQAETINYGTAIDGSEIIERPSPITGTDGHN